MLKNIKSVFRTNRVFIFLVIFRWASLIPAVLTLTRVSAQNILPPLTVLSIAILINVVISIFNHRLNQVVVDYPAAMSIDLLFSAFVLWASGGSHSPYYLYALSPLLAGAFFFQARGALIVSLVFTPLYFISSDYRSQPPADTIVLITQLTGIWLFPLLFAFPSTLLKDINRAREELFGARDELAEQNKNLTTAHRQLKVIHDLTVLLQAAPDLVSVEQRVLGAVTTGLGFRRAIVGMVDPALEEMGNWMLYPANSTFPAIAPLPLKSENGEIFKALLERRIFKTGTDDEILISHAGMNSWLKTCRWYVYPLSLREHTVGILMVEMDRNEELTRQREDAIMMVSNQASLALGTTILCIDRARRLAVETERNRIARDIHDTVAQSLFGIVYSLEACIAMLPEQAADVKTELIELRSLASGAHDEVRRSVFDLWPSALTIELFMADLTNYINSCCRPRSFNIIFNHSGDFNSLPSGLRRTIYRMAQEALANSARHSGVNSARLCLNISEDHVHLNVSDDGRGFEPGIALSRSVNREHFGLHGIQERARAMGGDCEIISQPEAGARILIHLPIGRHHHA
ncbi:MAG: GAF domain-containing sensor histidine kinase [Chloroflexi bacterium]|nr:GAF domain-containing sensor histidine kinase [Chloroflexota bacterium]